MNEIRTAYIEAFHRGLAELKAEGRDCYPEICLELNTKRSQEVYRLFVCDVIEKKADGSTGVIEFNIDPIQATFPGLTDLRPLVWNSITFTCTRSHFVEADVLAWAHRWIHDESPPLGAQDGLTGIIHSVTEPEVSGEFVSVAVDFGSAPIQALDELLAVFSSGLQSAISVFSEMSSRRHR